MFIGDWMERGERNWPEALAVFDLGTLGQLGYVPGWPGAAVYPPQPMVAQTRSVLDQYAAHSGRYKEVVIPNTGHTPFVEEPDKFASLLEAHLSGR